MADRDVALTVPGVSRAEEYPTALNCEPCVVPHVAKNRAAFLDSFEWKFGGRSAAPGAPSNLRDSALRVSEQYASEAGSRQKSSRLTLGRPRASLLAVDFPLNVSGPCGGCLGPRRIIGCRVSCPWMCVV